ncbi:uncharacterized protein LOC123714725 [Pieris brassicae]|uniref:uncharacterized protein LOC123714725 n=1 Tax=Pieris brassicae TaxID=7116 RepID=UPI001E6606C2|nr:uncharacterized protein LOC123714725 [Pieris brassicae]XP_045525112.1 uncharacterized protein LOC123714725 [Pieris brassicae]
MSNEISHKADAQQGDELATETETKAGNSDPKTGNTETKEPNKRTVSFNRDVHVKRFGTPRERSSIEASPSIRKEPFTHLSEKELIEEANKVIAQAQSVTCTADNPPEKFFSLPHRRKYKEDRSGRRNSDDATSTDGIAKTLLGRSSSDVTSKKRKERTSLSTLFRRGQRTKSPDTPVVVKTKPIVVVKRSKSDVSDLKSNTTLTKNKPQRKRSGSETEEFLKSLRNKKTQLSPIIESSPREDYFKKVSPLDVFQKKQLTETETCNSESEHSITDITKVNPIEKPPRHKAQDYQEPKPPSRTKREKSGEIEKESSPPISETPKRSVEVKKNNLANNIELWKEKNNLNVQDNIKDSITKIEKNVYGTKDMIHSSQQPPKKPPLTRGHTVDHMVRILKEDQQSPPPKSHLISSTHGSNINQPFSYTKPSTSPDPNLFVRTASPERASTPVNKMVDKGVVYAKVIKDHDDLRLNFPKQTMYKTYSPPREKLGNFSDEDEGLGYEDRYKYNNKFGDTILDYDYKRENNFDSIDGFNIKKSPIISRFSEYKLTSFDDEPTYANEDFKKGPLRDPINTFRGRADGMDTKPKKPFETDTKIDLDFNELSHRRQLLESRLNARKQERGRLLPADEPVLRYLTEPDPIYEAEKRMKQTEKYVNDTVKYYRHTLEREGFENNVTDYKFDPDSQVKYNTESRSYHKTTKQELDRREFIDSLEKPKRFNDEKKVFPPEPEYEPPSLESNPGKLVSPDEYKEKKYKVKKPFNSSHEHLHSGQKYKVKDDWFGKRKGHYSSNPEIAQEREDEYANLRYNPKQESFHNSLRRVKNKDITNYNSVRRHDSGDSRDYYREQLSPRRYDFDSRLVDSGIENDFRLNSSGEIHKSRRRRNESDDDVRNTSLFLASERQFAEDNYPGEQIYANSEYLAKRKEYKNDRMYAVEGKYDDSQFDPKPARYDKSPKHDDKTSAKPPKVKKLSGLEKVKQLFSRDSSKKSKKEKEKELVQKPRTRVLKSPEHLARHDSDYRRYTDPEPSDTEVRKKDYREDSKYRHSREDLDRYPRDEKRREESSKNTDVEERFGRTLKEERRYKEERRRHTSSERESDHQRTDRESERRTTRSRTAGPLDSPALAERYRERRRLATPSPTPSPPRRQPTQSSSWFKSIDRLGKKRDKHIKVEKESIITTEDELPRRSYPKSSKPLNSPAKNLRFFGDTDPESDANVKQTVTKTKSHPIKSHGTLRKTISNSSTGQDEVDHEIPSKSYSLSNLQRDEKLRDSVSPRTKDYYKRNLQNISEMSNSEVDSQFSRKMASKPPISPYDRSRSHSSNKTLKGSKGDLLRQGREERGSSSELRTGKPDINRDLKHRRRTPVANSGESSTEGDSSHQSQRSVVYLHATTVGDIPDPGRVTRNRSRDDVSSVMSSNIQVRNSTKTFSIFAPWTPKHYNDQYDVHYAQKPRKKKETTPKKYASTKNLSEDRPATLQKKSYSQTTLNRRPNQNNRLTSSSTTLYRPKRGNESQTSQSTIPRKSNGRSQSSEILSLNDRNRVARSTSIPKDKKAGWFKLSKTKKQENTRVR